MRNEGQHDRLIFRPILHWTAQNTFAIQRLFGLDPNPLYTQGASRVGCWPCINENKEGLAAMFQRAPWVVEKLRHYEITVGKASKRGQATFYAAGTTPQGAALVAAQKRGERLNEPLPTIFDIAEWARTTRGGKQFNGLALMLDDGAGCSSQYGLCE